MIITGKEPEFIHGKMIGVRGGALLVAVEEKSLSRLPLNFIYTDVVILTRRDWDRIQSALGEKEIP